MINKEYKQMYVLGFIFDSKLEKILLIKKNKSPKGLEKMISKLNGIGGKVEDYETCLGAICRECKEETGLDLSNWNSFCTLETKFGEVDCFYTVTDKIYDFKQMEDEEINIYRIDDFEEYTTQDYNWMKNCERMSNLDWLIPMALNHYQKLDKAKNFLVIESY